MPNQRMSRYAPYWPILSAVVRFAIDRAMCRHCGALHGQPHPEHGRTAWLSAAHLVDRDPLADRLDNLAALCQWCHMRHDSLPGARKGCKQRPGQAKLTRMRKRNLAEARARVEAFDRYMNGS